MKKTPLKLSNFQEHFEEWLKQGKFLENLLQAGKFLSQGARSNIDVEMLDLSDAYFEKFRAEGNINEVCNVGNVNWDIGQGLRKIAHVLYRQLRKQYKTRPINSRFLNPIV